MHAACNQGTPIEWPTNRLKFTKKKKKMRKKCRKIKRPNTYMSLLSIASRISSQSNGFDRRFCLRFICFCVLFWRCGRCGKIPLFVFSCKYFSFFASLCSHRFAANLQIWRRLILVRTRNHRNKRKSRRKNSYKKHAIRNAFNACFVHENTRAPLINFFFLLSRAVTMKKSACPLLRLDGSVPI